MDKPAVTEYYNLEKAAEILAIAPAEVNQLRESGKLRAFRDGANWKFRRIDIEACLAERIRGRNSQPDLSGEGNEDYGVTQQVDFDPVGDVDLPSDNDLIKVNAGQNVEDDFEITEHHDSPKEADGFDLAVSITDDEFKLADEEGGTSVLSLADYDEKPQPNAGSGLVPITEDSDPFIVANESEVDLAKIEEVSQREDSSVQGQSAGAGSQTLGLMVASAFADKEPPKAEKQQEAEDAAEATFTLAKETDDVPDFVEESSVLALSKPNDDSIAVALEAAKSDENDESDDFDLEPVTDSLDDNSESSSQVIAIDSAGFTTNDTPFGGFDGGVPEFESADAFDGDSIGGPFGSTSTTGEFASVTSSANFAKPTEYEYTNGALTAIVIAAAVMVLPGLMLIDMIAGMWSWREPFVLNSVIMNTIAGWFGLV